MPSAVATGYNARDVEVETHSGRVAGHQVPVALRSCGAAGINLDRPAVQSSCGEKNKLHGRPNSPDDSAVDAMRIKREVMKGILELCRNAHPYEVGGLLLGKRTVSDYVLIPGRFYSYSIYIWMDRNWFNYGR